MSDSCSSLQKLGDCVRAMVMALDQPERMEERIYNVGDESLNLTKRQKELLEEFQETLGKDGGRQSPRQQNWFEGVKNFFDDMTS